MQTTVAAPAPHISALNMSDLTFGPLDSKDGKSKVEVYRDGTSTQKNNRLNRYALCVDAMKPMSLRFPLDAVREGEQGNPYRRGLTLEVTDPKTVEALRGIDETIIKTAVKNSVQWFKGKQLSEEQIRFRYKPILYKVRDEDTSEVCKIKVKCPGTDWPTSLHVRTPDGKHRKNGGRIEQLGYGAHVVPIVSASYGIWFMGGASGNFGITFQAEDMIIIPGESVEDNLSQFASATPLIMEEDDGERNTESQPSPKRKHVDVELLDDGVPPATSE